MRIKLFLFLLICSCSTFLTAQEMTLAKMISFHENNYEYFNSVMTDLKYYFFESRQKDSTVDFLYIRNSGTETLFESEIFTYTKFSSGGNILLEYSTKRVEQFNKIKSDARHLDFKITSQKKYHGKPAVIYESDYYLLALTKENSEPFGWVYKSYLEKL